MKDLFWGTGSHSNSGCGPGEPFLGACKQGPKTAPHMHPPPPLKSPPGGGVTSLFSIYLSIYCRGLPRATCPLGESEGWNG